jgi:hypothetical protein
MRWEVDETGSVSSPVARFDIIGAELGVLLLESQLIVRWLLRKGL